jgi:hypothetical protein
LVQREVEKRFFELHVNARFDERVLAECLWDVATDKKLRTAKLEWINDERLLISCAESVRLNTQQNMI